MRFLVLVAGLLLFPSFALPALAFLEVKTEFDHYEIKGRTDWELRHAMRKKGIRENGKSFDAHTDWYVKWDYRFESQGNDCRVKSLQTVLTIHYKMPRWVKRDKASPELRAQWDKYYAALLNHEEGHGNFGRKAAAEIEQAIESTGKGLECKQFKETANAAAYKILAKYQAEEKEYDISTKHGQTQGVIFP